MENEADTQIALSPAKSHVDDSTAVHQPEEALSPIRVLCSDSPASSKATTRGVTKFDKISEHILIPTKAHVAHIEETKRLKNEITHEMDPWW